MILSIVTGPTVEPVSLAEAKSHLRVDLNDDDTLITNLITASRRYIESTLCNRAFITQTWDYFLQSFPNGDEIEIPLPPLQSITSIKYKDKAGVEAVFPSAEYIVDKDSAPARVRLAYGKSWPSFEPYPLNAVAIRFVAGYGDSGVAVPQELRQAILLMVGHLYENREMFSTAKLSEVPFAVFALCASYRVGLL